MKQTILVILATTLIGCGDLARAKKLAIEIKCRNNLKQIANSIHGWAIDNNKDLGDKVSLEDLKSEYLPDNLTCQGEGKYGLTTVQDPPTCTAEGHSLKEDFIKDYYSEDALKKIRDNFLEAQAKK